MDGAEGRGRVTKVNGHRHEDVAESRVRDVAIVSSLGPSDDREPRGERRTVVSAIGCQLWRESVLVVSDCVKWCQIALSGVYLYKSKGEGRGCVVTGGRPLAPPVINHGREGAVVSVRSSCISLSLVPHCTLDGHVKEWMDHGIPQH